MLFDRDFIDKKFHTILEDSIFFMEEISSINYQDSDSPTERYIKFTRGSAFARASILNSALLLEATANCCISTLELSKNLYSDIERMRTLSKFEYYLGTLNTGVNIDRGLLVTQKAKDLISLRNECVHPKHYQSKWKKVDDNTLELSIEDSQFLKLPKSLWRCEHEHAENCLKAALDFISYFFIDLCKFNEFQVARIIYGSDCSPNFQKLTKLHYDIKADVRFLIDIAKDEEFARKHFKNGSRQQ